MTHPCPIVPGGRPILTKCSGLNAFDVHVHVMCSYDQIRMCLRTRPLSFSYSCEGLGYKGHISEVGCVHLSTTKIGIGRGVMYRRSFTLTSKYASNFGRGVLSPTFYVGEK